MPTLDTTKVLITMSMKEVFKDMNRNEYDLLMLWKKHELMRGYLYGIVGPTDLGPMDLDVILEEKENGMVQMDPFLQECQQWHENFEEKHVKITQGNLNLLHYIQSSVDKLVFIVNQDLDLMDKVHTWAKDLQILTLMKGQRYCRLMELYIVEELDKLKDWIQKKAANNKVIEGLHEDIQRLRDQTQK